MARGSAAASGTLSGWPVSATQPVMPSPTVTRRPVDRLALVLRDLRAEGHRLERPAVLAEHVDAGVVEGHHALRLRAERGADLLDAGQARELGGDATGPPRAAPTRRWAADRAASTTVPTSRRAWTRAMARSSSLNGSLRDRSRTRRPPRVVGQGSAARHRAAGGELRREPASQPAALSLTPSPARRRSRRSPVAASAAGPVDRAAHELEDAVPAVDVESARRGRRRRPARVGARAASVSGVARRGRTAPSMVIASRELASVRPGRGPAAARRLRMAATRKTTPPRAMMASPMEKTLASGRGRGQTKTSPRNGKSVSGPMSTEFEKCLDGQLGHAVEGQPGLRRGGHGAAVGEHGHEVEERADGDDGQARQRQVAQQRRQDRRAWRPRRWRGPRRRRARATGPAKSTSWTARPPSASGHQAKWTCSRLPTRPPRRRPRRRPATMAVQQQHGPAGASERTAPARSGAGGMGQRVSRRGE